MELRKKELHMLRKKSEAQNQITFDEDFNVPDHKADIGQMIQKKGEVEIDQGQVSEGKAVIQGQLVFRLLYVADSPGRTVSSLEGKLPIEETLHLDEVRSGDKVCLKWEIEDLTIHLINSRKLNIKAIVEFFAVVDENTQVAVPVELKGADQISTKKKTIRVLTLGVHKKDILRKKEEITLASNKPNIHQILWKDIQVRGLEMRAQEGKVTARGELSVFVLYVSDDEANPLQWLEQTIPFSGELSCTGCTMDMIPYIDAAVQSGDQTGCRRGRTGASGGCGAGTGYETVSGGDGDHSSGCLYAKTGMYPAEGAADAGTAGGKKCGKMPCQ